VKSVADDFYRVTDALELVNIPFSMYMPFTKCWWRKCIADRVHVIFTKCATDCKANMSIGAKPTCIVDQWVLHMMESKRYNERIAAGEAGIEKPTNLIRWFSDEEIGRTIFTFLFAALRTHPAVPPPSCSRFLPSGPTFLIASERRTLPYDLVIETGRLIWTCLNVFLHPRRGQEATSSPPSNYVCALHCHQEVPGHSRVQCVQGYHDCSVLLRSYP
jgi:hypothetical protein